MNQYELEQLWVEGALPDVTYKFGNEVRMKGGRCAGEVGRIVALFNIDPAPHYVIEFPDGASETRLNLKSIGLRSEITPTETAANELREP